MVAEYYDKSKKSSNSAYESCIENIMKYGITAKMSPVRVSADKIKKERDIDTMHKLTYNTDQDKQSVEEEGLYGRGLFHYSKWWEKSKVDIFVNGCMLTGTPVFTDENTLRVINDEYSYFIPLEKVDYIRTANGLKACPDTKADD